MLVTKQLKAAIDFEAIEKYDGSQWLPSTVWLLQERNSYRFGPSGGWINNDRICKF